MHTLNVVQQVMLGLGLRAKIFGFGLSVLKAYYLMIFYDVYLYIFCIKRT